MKDFLNYLGQFRVYSALDLLLLLVAAGATNYEIAGVLLLNFGFMAHLEVLHKHSYRKNIPYIVPIILYIPGLFLFSRLEGFIYVILSHLYGQKKGNVLGVISPVIRGLQTYVLIGAVSGYTSTIALLGLLLIILRNLVGDLRDVSKDKVEGVKTLPILLDQNRDVKYGHLMALFITTIVWWTFTTLAWPILILVLLVEWATYYWTPRTLSQKTP